LQELQLTCVLLAAKYTNDIHNNFKWETTGQIKVNGFYLWLHAQHSVIASFSESTVDTYGILPAIPP